MTDVKPTSPAGNRSKMMAKRDGRRRTPWFPRNTPPVRPGLYECGVRWTSAMPTLVLWALEWDGKGFKVPMPMMVKQWRGLAKRPRGVTL